MVKHIHQEIDKKNMMIKLFAAVNTTKHLKLIEQLKSNPQNIIYNDNEDDPVYLNFKPLTQSSDKDLLLG